MPRDTAKTPRERQQEFMVTLARAITQWQNVEIGLFQVYASCMRCADYAVASAAFHTVVNFNTRLAMTHAAAQIALADRPELEQWNRLHRRMRKWVKKRNDLVHSMVFNDATDLKRGIIPYVRPSIFNVNADPNRRYGVKQIDEIAQSFGKLSRALDEFNDRLYPLDLGPPSSREKSS